MSDYHVNIFWSDEDGGYIADIPDLEACSAFGATAEEALAELGEAMNQTSASADREVDEFEIAGLTTVRGSIVNAPLVAQCRANLECSVTQIIETGTQPNLSAVVFGEIVAYQVDESVLDDTGRIDSAELDVIGRMGGRSYTYTRDTFELDRPAG